jgi:ankyrin repeat protein
MFSHYEVLELLLYYGLDPIAIDIVGNTLLSLAIMNGLNQAIMLLIE